MRVLICTITFKIFLSFISHSVKSRSFLFISFELFTFILQKSRNFFSPFFSVCAFSSVPCPLYENLCKMRKSFFCAISICSSKNSLLLIYSLKCECFFFSLLFCFIRKTSFIVVYNHHKKLFYYMKCYIFRIPK